MLYNKGTDIMLYRIAAVELFVTTQQKVELWIVQVWIHI